MALKTRSVVEALAAELQSRILSGVIEPGTALAELTVAGEFDVARPTARAAIEQLVHVGLLRRSRNKTARVPLLDADDVSDLYTARLAVERSVVSLLAERGEHPAEAATALARLTSAIERHGDVTTLVETDIEFHRALVTTTGSPRIRRMHEVVIGEAHLCMAQVQLHSLLHPRIIAEEHGRILDAIENRDAQRAMSELDRHLLSARDKLVAYLRSSAPRGTVTAS